MTNPKMWFTCSIDSIGGIISLVPQIWGSHRLGCTVVGPTARACMNPSTMSSVITSSVSTS
ncbi:hypothetical protein D3C87_1656810 [compost metagenome]